MRQLTRHDASFLDSDTQHANSNVTFVQRALHTLGNVPVFYSHLLELVAGSRRTIGSWSFRPP